MEQAAKIRQQPLASLNSHIIELTNHACTCKLNTGVSVWNNNVTFVTISHAFQRSMLQDVTSAAILADRERMHLEQQERDAILE